MTQINTWDDVEDILFDGTPEEIANVSCPDCGNRIDYAFYSKNHSMEIACKNCGIKIRCNCSSNIVPNCVNRP